MILIGILHITVFRDILRKYQFNLGNTDYNHLRDLYLRKVMYPHQKGVVHDLETLQCLTVPLNGIHETMVKVSLE